MKRIAVLWMVLLLISGTLTSVEAAASQIVFQGPATSKMIALTFDDGSDGTNIEEILRILDNQQIKATFFLTGGGTKHHPEKIRKIVSRGHEIGNHSNTHPDFRNLSMEEMKNELKRTEAIIQEATGILPNKIFRAPFGAYNSNVLEGVGRAGYPYTIQWTIDTIDWRGDSADVINNKVINNAKPGAIVLMHTGQGASGTPEALPGMIKELKRMGYSFTTVSKLLNVSTAPSQPTDPPVQDPKPVEPKPAPVKPKPVVEPKLPSEYYYYAVQPGDTLFGIAQRVGSTVSELSDLNKIANPERIYAGQRLIIPGKKPAEPEKPEKPSPVKEQPVLSTKMDRIQGGENLYGLARRHGLEVREILRYNRVKNPVLYFEGQMVIIPVTESENQVKVYVFSIGDLLRVVAKIHGVGLEDLLRTNRINISAGIKPGQVIKI